MMKRWEHGGDTTAFQKEYGKTPLDFSANVNPFGVPESVREAAVKAASEIDRYPDPRCRELTEAIAEKNGISPDQVLCGNGASDLICRFALAASPKSVLIPAPTFSEYENACRVLALGNGEAPEIRRVYLSEQSGFLLPSDLPDAIDKKTDAVFLCEPNNPTGRTTDISLLRKILIRCHETGTHLFLDECFLDFLEEPSSHTLLPELNGFSELILLRAFTKSHGMAGLRLGWCMTADRDLLERMRQAGPPWNVSVPAQAAGLAALSDEDTTRQIRRLVSRERPVLAAALTDLGFRVIPGEANFLLFYGDPSLDQRLRDRGILIRNCENFEGLGSGWFRTAIRRPEENRILIDTLKEMI